MNNTTVGLCILGIVLLLYVVYTVSMNNTDEIKLTVNNKTLGIGDYKIGEDVFNSVDKWYRVAFMYNSEEEKIEGIHIQAIPKKLVTWETLMPVKGGE